jgi:hypothetical protein
MSLTISNLSLCRLAKIHVQQSLTLRWCSFSWVGRAYVSVRFDHHGGQYIEHSQPRTDVFIFRLKVAYLNVTINSAMWNGKPKIGTDRTSQTPRTSPVQSYGSWFAPPRGSRWACWMGLELIRSVFGVQTQPTCRLPRPVVNTSHFLVHLLILVCFSLIMFHLALNEWPLCTKIVISHNTAHCGASGSLH